MKKILKSNVGIMGKTALVAVLSVFLATPNGAQAAFFHIEDTDDVNETITVTANDFEFGLTLNGAPFQGGLGNPVSRTFNEADGPITFDGSWIGIGPGGQVVPRSATVYFIEEGNPSLVSDVLRYSYTFEGFAGHLQGDFVSFIDDVLFPQAVAQFGEPTTIWREEQGNFDFSNAFISASANSTPVPEPSTYAAGALLLLPLAFGAFRKLRKSQKVA